MEDNIPHSSLTEQTELYMMGSFNESRKYFINYLLHGKQIWKDNFRKSNLNIKSRYVKVDKTTTPWSIIIPRDMDRFYNLSTMDILGSLHSFVLDNTINEVELPKGNECQACGETNDYGQCFNDIQVTTRTVVISGADHLEKTWRKLCPNGDIVELREVPVLKVNPDNTTSVEVIKQQKYIANLEVKSCGCVKKTISNKETILTTCGFLLPACEAQMIRGALSKTGTNVGRVKVANGRLWVDGADIPDCLILSYQTNGTTLGGSIMVPDFAANVIQFGIAWRSAALRPGQARTRFEVRDLKAQYDTQVQEMDEYINPVRIEDFMALQMSIPLWGGMSGAQCKNDGLSGILIRNEGISTQDIQNIVNNSLTNIQQNVTIIGGAGGNGGAFVEEYIQSAPSTTWVIIHGLGYNPNVTTVDTNDESIEGEVEYLTDGTSLKITFNVALAGKAFLT